MKIIKYLFIVLLVIIAVFLIISAFMPPKMAVTRSIVIDAPPSVVFVEVNNLKNWDKWSPWKALDSAMKQTFSENPEGPGAWVSWTGPVSGSGKQVIVESRKDEMVRTSLDFDEEGGSLNFTEWNFRDSSGTTIASWGFDGEELPFYYRIMAGIAQGMIEKEFDNGLKNLKTVCEAKPENSSAAVYDIREIQMEERVYIAKRDSLPFDSISVFFEKNFHAIFSAIEKAKIETEGAPAGLYFKWDQENMSSVLAAAVQVKSNSKVVVEGFETIVVQAGKNLLIEYRGAYEKSADAHYAMDAYMKEKSLEQMVPVVEEYVTDPGSEPDTMKWLTNIYYPVK